MAIKSGATRVGFKFLWMQMKRLLITPTLTAHPLPPTSSLLSSLPPSCPPHLSSSSPPPPLSSPSPSSVPPVSSSPSPYQRWGTPGMPYPAPHVCSGQRSDELYTQMIQRTEVQFDFRSQIKIKRNYMTALLKKCQHCFWQAHNTCCKQWCHHITRGIFFNYSVFHDVILYSYTCNKHFLLLSLPRIRVHHLM